MDTIIQPAGAKGRAHLVTDETLRQPTSTRLMTLPSTAQPPPAHRPYVMEAAHRPNRSDSWLTVIEQPGTPIWGVLQDLGFEDHGDELLVKSILALD